VSRRLGSSVLGCFGLLVGAGASAAIADRAPIEGWLEMTFAGKRENAWTATDENGIRVVSTSSVSVLYRSVDAELGETPCLSWRWRVDETMGPTNLARRGYDDRPLAVYVSFPYLPEQAGFWERFWRPFVELAKGPDAPGRVLSYVWGGYRERGETLASPYLGASGRLKILRSGDAPTERWFDERVDVAADYRRAFDAPPPDPMQVAISADSDDTDSRSVALIRNLAFGPCAADMGRVAGSGAYSLIARDKR